jgi:hypothetical protein
MNFGKCPKCESIITAAQVEDVTLNVGFQPQWKGFSYLCPACHSVLGVQLNPLASEHDILASVQKIVDSSKAEILNQVSHAGNVILAEIRGRR